MSIYSKRLLKDFEQPILYNEFIAAWREELKEKIEKFNNDFSYKYLKGEEMKNIRMFREAIKDGQGRLGRTLSWECPECGNCEDNLDFISDDFGKPKIIRCRSCYHGIRLEKVYAKEEIYYYTDVNPKEVKVRYYSKWNCPSCRELNKDYRRVTEGDKLTCTNCYKEFILDKTNHGYAHKDGYTVFEIQECDS